MIPEQPQLTSAKPFLHPISLAVHKSTDGQLLGVTVMCCVRPQPAAIVTQQGIWGNSVQFCKLGYVCVQCCCQTGIPPTTTVDIDITQLPGKCGKTYLMIGYMVVYNLSINKLFAGVKEPILIKIV